MSFTRIQIAGKSVYLDGVCHEFSCPRAALDAMILVGCRNHHPEVVKTEKVSAMQRDFNNTIRLCQAYDSGPGGARK